MENPEFDLTLGEIRQSQSEIASEMDENQLSKEDQVRLERASCHLRNLERLLTDSTEDALISQLKNETSSLRELTVEMNKESEHLFKIAEILGKVVSITGQLIDILDAVK